MKKKHAKALASLQSWLGKQTKLDEKVLESFKTIKNALDAIPEGNKSEEQALPVPTEISSEPETIALFSDGGCRGNPGPGSFAYVIQGHSGEVIAEGVEFEAHTTNNKMELSGPLKGLKELKSLLPGIGRDPLLTKIKVITDSKYVVDGMKSWVQGWKSRGWKKADNKAPENLELWQELDQVRDYFMQVEWMWVRGHEGHPQNEYCDRKANEIMDERIQ